LRTGRAVYNLVVIRFGDPTQNLTIPADTNRTLRLANLHDAGKVWGLIRENLARLDAVIRWKARHCVRLLRMGQALIPFASHTEFPYDWGTKHGEGLEKAGKLARELGIRLSMHPGRYIQPGSPKLVERSLAELRYVARIFDFSLTAWESRGTRPKLHLSSQNPEKQAGAHTYSVELAEWQALVDALEGRAANVTVEAKGKEHALVPLGVEF